MRHLPAPRGPLTDALFAALERPPHRMAPLPTLSAPSGEDMQLALYCCYELHYRGIGGVDERWEWSPSLLEQHQQLEARFEAWLREVVGAADGWCKPDEVDVALRAIAAN